MKNKNVLMKAGPYEIRSMGENVTELLIYGDIGDSWYEESVTAKSVVEQLQGVNTEEIIVRVNSYGGSVSDGIAIYNALKRHDALITVVIDGVAVSAASLIAMVGDTIEIAENAIMMIHAPWGGLYGNAAEMRKYADVLDTYSKAMTTSYVNKTGKDSEEIFTMLTDGEDHWFTAEEAVAEGFADVLSESVDDVLAFGFGLDKYNKVPVSIAASFNPGHKHLFSLKSNGLAKNKQTKEPKAGAQLASVLNDRIDELETEDRTRSDIISDMADEAGISSGTVNQILNGEIDCPPLDRLQGFAVALDMSESTIVDAAESDGCEYGDNNDENASGCGRHNNNESEEVSMKENEKIAADAKKTALKKEDERKAGIRSAFKPFMAQEGVRELCDTCIDDSEISAQDANDKILAHLGKNSGSLGSNAHVDIVADEKDKFIKGASASINARAQLEKDDGANQYRGYSLMELARASLVMNNVDATRMSKLDMVAAAFTHSSGDFANLLSGSANKAMLRGYEEAEETFQSWTTPGELPDFKAGSRVGLNDFASLREVKSGGEYKYVTVGECSESIVLATYGELFAIDRQAIINDDLEAFTRIPRKMGSAAIRTIGDLVYAILTDNPKMSDGVALFHATHKNLITPTTGIFTASVDAMRVAMAKQKAGGKSLNIRLGNIIVPTALEGTAKVVRESQFEVGSTTSTKANTTPNTVAGTFEVVSDARLDDSSATTWYGAANSGMHDTIEVAYLDGNQAPMLEQQNGWSIDGVEFKVRMDAGVSPLDFRTMAKN